MNDQERLEGLEDALDRLRTASADHVILVEGNKDVAALESLDVNGDIFCVQVNGGPVRAAEHAWRAGKDAVILTDWDRRGGSLAHDLRENLSSLGVGYDDTIRSDIAFYLRPYSKDVESIDSVRNMLISRCQDNCVR